METIQLELKLINMKKNLLLILVFFTYSSASSCSCIGKITFKKEFRRSVVVVTGKVIGRKIIEIKDSLRPQLKIQKVKYTIQVNRVYKGRIKNNLIEVTTGIGGGDCGFEFMIEKEYIIYCTYENKYYNWGDIVKKFLYTDICSRTRLTSEDELKLLNKKCKNKFK